MWCIKRYTPCEGVFPCQTKIVFGCINIFNWAKHQKLENTFYAYTNATENT